MYLQHSARHRPLGLSAVAQLLAQRQRVSWPLNVPVANGFASFSLNFRRFKADRFDYPWFYG